MRARHFLLAAALALSACAAGGVRLSHHDTASTWSPGEFAWAAAGRDLWVVVAGNPFGMDAAAFAAAVTDAMQGRHWGQRTNFTTAPGADARIRYRAVLLFDPPAALNGSRLCAGPSDALPGESAGGEVVLFAAFCHGKRLRTQVKGRIADAAGPDDPAFRALVGEVTNALFPPDRGVGRERGGPVFLIP